MELPQLTSVVVNAECEVRSSETHWNQGLIANLTGLLPFVFWIEVQETIGIAFVCCILWIICGLAIPCVDVAVLEAQIAYISNMNIYQ